jgi:hypothetical protein
MLKEYIKIAYIKPHLRPVLLPLIKCAMEFSTKEQLDEYLKNHPNADRKKHFVKQTQSENTKSDDKNKKTTHKHINIDKAVYKAKMSFNHAHPNDFMSHLRMNNSVNEMVSKVKNMEWDPKNKKIPLEMKKACETINSRNTFGRFLFTMGTGAGVGTALVKSEAFAYPTALAIGGALKANPTAAAKLGAKALETFGQDAVLAVGGAAIATGVAVTAFAMKKVMDHFENKDKKQEQKIKSEDNVSEVAFDIFMGKYTPVEINNQYKNKTDDIAKNLANKKIKPEQALKEIEKLEKEYKEKVIPGIEKALTSSGWEKDNKGEYKFTDKKFESTFNSFFKKAKDNEEDSSMFLQFRHLKNRIKELDAMNKTFENPDLFKKAISEVIEENS